MYKVVENDIFCMFDHLWYSLTEDMKFFSTQIFHLVSDIVYDSAFEQGNRLLTTRIKQNASFDDVSQRFQDAAG